MTTITLTDEEVPHIIAALDMIAHHLGDMNPQGNLCSQVAKRLAREYLFPSSPLQPTEADKASPAVAQEK